MGRQAKRECCSFFSLKLTESQFKCDCTLIGYMWAIADCVQAQISVECRCCLFVNQADQNYHYALKTKALTLKKDLFQQFIKILLQC